MNHWIYVKEGILFLLGLGCIVRGCIVGSKGAFRPPDINFPEPTVHPIEKWEILDIQLKNYARRTTGKGLRAAGWIVVGTLLIMWGMHHVNGV